MTMPLAQPGQLILLSAVIAFTGTVAFSFGILVLNYRVLPRALPPFARPGRLAGAALLAAACLNLALMAAYLWMKLAG
jgi:hypothetical protein